MVIQGRHRAARQRPPAPIIPETSLPRTNAINDEINRLLAQTREMWEQGAETMWRNEFADIVIDMLARGDTVTRETLERVIVTRLNAEDTPRLTRATLIGMLRALDGRPPS